MLKFGTISSALALAALALTPFAYSGAHETSRPVPQQKSEHRVAAAYNIVYVLVDDLRYDAMGFLTPGLRTPNIDFMAKNGVYFPNAVVTSSLCSPSRATILTGMTARNHRIVDNNDSSEAGLTFFPKYLQQAGYQTAFFGKWHMGQASDRPRPGFDKWVSFKGQGTYFPTDYVPPELLRKGVLNQLNVDGAEINRKGYITDELTDYTLDWLEHGRDPNKPFFVYLSHKGVHTDPKPPERYVGQYKDLPIKLPASMADTEENYRGKPLWVRNQRNSWHGVDFMFNGNEALQDYVRRYYSTLSPIDDSLGRVMKYLRDNKLEKNTLIIFTSDNGFQLGDHGLIDKRDAYEPSVRVPFVMYAPGLLPKGAVNQARIRNLDLAPTLLDLAGIARPSQFEGRSFLPLAEGKAPASDWNSVDFVYEYYWEYNYPQTPTTFAIVRNNLKYIQYYGVWDTEELYDLTADPDEMKNLIDDPAYLAKKVELRKALFNSLANRQGENMIPYGPRVGSGMVKRNRHGSPAADFPEAWMREPNAYDRMNDLFPDSEEKLEAEKKHKPYIPWHLLFGT